MVGNVIELVFENDALPDGNPVTVVQFLSKKGESSPPFRNNMLSSG